MEKEPLRQVLTENPVLFNHIQAGMDAAKFLSQPGESAPGHTEQTQALVKLFSGLNHQEKLFLIIELADSLIDPAIHQAETPEDRGCRDALKLACWLPSSHLCLLIRELALYGLFLSAP